MMSKQKYPISVQSFEVLRERGYVYVDKTDLMYELAQHHICFLCRPRRFGKSLLLSTLEAYFRGKKQLFEGLKVMSLENEWQQYLVFHLDFNGVNFTDSDGLDNKLDYALAIWENEYHIADKAKNIGDRFVRVLQQAYVQTGKRCVVLIDEYDKPLTDTIGQHELQEKIRSILQGLYGIMKKADRYIRFAFLTGVTRYGKLGIFSAANNPRDISMSDDYASICGITESELHNYFDAEVEIFAKKQHVDKGAMYEMLKQKYDGYHFSSNSEDIYNPFSLLNALSDKQLGSYWFATGTPTYLVTILSRSNVDIPEFEGDLLANGEMLAAFGNGESNLIAALYQSGYLTIKGSSKSFYELGFPNEEVSEGLTQVLIPNYVASQTSDRKDLDLIKLRQFIESDNVRGFMTQIQQIMSQIPFESNEAKLIEANFRNMLYLMIRSTGHKVLVEYPVLGGRIDVFFQTEQFAYVIECKRDQSAAEALAQIDEKKYADKLSVQNKKIVKIGVNFSTEERNLTEWKEG